MRYKNEYCLFQTLADGYWRSTGLGVWSQHVMIRSITTSGGSSYGIGYVGIDRTLKFAFHSAALKADRPTAAAFLETAPYELHTILTGNGIQFADLPRNRDGWTARWRVHRFDQICRERGIEHRLTKPNHPWINGQVERMTAIKNAAAKRYHYDSHDQLRRHLQLFIDAHNHGRRLKMRAASSGHKTQIDPYRYSSEHDASPLANPADQWCNRLLRRVRAGKSACIRSSRPPGAISAPAFANLSPRPSFCHDHAAKTACAAVNERIVVTRIGIYGSLGRMGQAIVAAMPDLNAVHAGGIDFGEDPSPIACDSDVVVDFSAPAALDAHLAAVRAAGTPIVIGTTGLGANHHAMIDAAAREIAVLQTGNTSLGLGMLLALVRDAAAKLGSEWDIEIAEMHHREKVDAPSGTALMLGEAAAMGRGSTLADSSVVGRAGLTGARARATIGFSSMRGGTVVGDHMVMFAGNGERIELAHRAEDRAIFARGAVRAALWLARQPAGRYTMDQVLGL